jgi:hypothetical protein
MSASPLRLLTAAAIAVGLALAPGAQARDWHGHGGYHGHYRGHRGGGGGGAAAAIIGGLVGLGVGAAIANQGYYAPPPAYYGPPAGYYAPPPPAVYYGY